MDPIDPSQIPLRDIHLPDPVSWWPIASGWWMLLGLVIVLLVVGIFWYRSRLGSVSKDLAARFSEIETDYQQHQDVHRLAKELSMLARQRFLADKGVNDAASLTGEQWQTYWRTKLSDSAVDLKVLEEALTVAPYRRDPGLDGPQLLSAFRLALLEKSQTKGAS